MVGALGGERIDHALANVGLLALPISPAVGDPRSMAGPSALIRAPGPAGAPYDRASPGRTGTSSRCCQSAATSRASRRAVSPIRSTTSPCSPGPARGVSNVIARPGASVTVRRGLLLVIEIACYALTMTMPAVGDLAPEVALPDETGTIHHLSDQNGRWTILYFYPEDDTPGCTTEACEFRDRNEVIHERGADVWGVSPDGAASHKKFREKFELPFTLLADEGHPVADAYGAWGEKQNYGRTYMGLSARPS